MLIGFSIWIIFHQRFGCQQTDEQRHQGANWPQALLGFTILAAKHVLRVL